MTNILTVALEKLGIIPKRKERFPNMTSAQAKEDDAPLEGAVKKEDASSADNENDTVTTLQVR